MIFIKLRGILFSAQDHACSQIRISCRVYTVLAFTAWKEFYERVAAMKSLHARGQLQNAGPTVLHVSKSFEERSITQLARLLFNEMQISGPIFRM